jgi:F-type H+-transporting ATPase subunit b
MLEINPVALLVQIANFLLLVYLLNRFLFRPIRGMLAKRAGKVEKLSDSAARLEASAHASEQEIQEGRDASRRNGLAEKERLKTEAQEEELRLIQEAMEASEHKVSEARKQLEASMASIRESLDLQVSALSREAASRILGRSVS